MHACYSTWHTSYEGRLTLRSAKRWLTAADAKRGALGQGLLQLAPQALVGKVEEQRRHRDVAGIDGGKVGALGGVGAAALEGQPIVGVAPGVAALVDGEEAGVATALNRDHGAGDLAGLPVGKVDVHHGGRRPVHRQQLAQETRRMRKGRLPEHRPAALADEAL